MLAAFAEQDREMISQRTWESFRVAKSRGVVMGVGGKAPAAKDRK